MPAIIDAASRIDINLIDDVLSIDNHALAVVHQNFYAGVDELKLLLKDGTILFVPTSFGKDSTVTLLMALEAYRQAILAGEIESDRPLISSTINTRMEAIPMTLYQYYGRKRLIAYAEQHGINLKHEIIMPTINDHYFVRFAGAQKLIANASRSGDCSVILKIKPSEKYVKSVIEAYPGRQVISVIGSRTEESARRSNNMAKQGIAKKSIEDLRGQLSAMSLGKVNVLNFAPLRDWSTDQVFDLLRIAGDKPLTKAGFYIPAFLPDFGLLTELYGNGSNETCSVAVGHTSGGAGCNGKARFGCTQCTMVGATDQSSTALARLERWRVLGVENATRLRDYLFRLSTDMSARAFHARAYDPVTFSRIALQPNILKPKHLEKIVRFAAQLTLESIRVAGEFKALVQSGREMDHPGMQDINSDPNLSPKIKRAFLEMYKEAVQEPRNLNYLFDQEHALLLSFRWAIDGIAAAPFRPLAILSQLEAGQGWLPYPKLNSELEALTGDKIKIITGDLPEAVMFRVFKEEHAEEFAKNPIDALTLWHRPADIADEHDEESNCTIGRYADHTARVDVTFTPAITVKTTDTDRADFIVTHADGQTPVRLSASMPQILSAKLAPKTISDESLSLLMETGLRDAINEHQNTVLDKAIGSLPVNITQAAFDALIASLTQPVTLTREVKHLKSHRLFAGYHDTDKKADPTFGFTRRTASVKRGKLVKGNTRLSFYNVERQSRLHRAHAQYSDLLLPDFGSHTEKTITFQQQINDESLTDNIHVDKQGMMRWLSQEGMARALELHDAYFNAKVSRRRRGLSFSLRTYGGTYPAELLMEQGVMTIAPAYKAQLQFILRRTQFFDSLGLFCFQSQSYADVVNHPKAITMATHRADKANILSIIRKARNDERRAVKVTLAKQQQGDHTALLNQIRDNLSLFESAAVQSISFAATGQASALFHLRFHTADVGAADMARVHRLWISLHLTDSTPDAILSKVLSANQLKAIKDNATVYLDACAMVAGMASRLASLSTRELQMWESTVEQLNALLSASDQATKAPISQYRGIIQTSPYAVTGSDSFSWNPSLENFKRLLGDKLAVMTQTLEQLAQGRVKLLQLADSGKRMGARRLSFANKLSVLTGRAA